MEAEKRAASIIRQAARDGADIVCLPEHWLPGNLANLEDSLPAIADEAKSSKITVIAGADFVSRKGKTTIESVLIDEEGKEVGRQRKVHLFGKENKIATPGDSYGIFRIKGVKLGIAICHDLVYPEVARIFALKGAELLFAPAMIVREGVSPWQLYVQTRSLENRIPIVSPTVTGAPRFTGGSLIADLREKRGIVHPKVTVAPSKREQLLVAEIDVKQMAGHRRQRLRARRVETYSGLMN